jgi:hypothetical protein
MFNVLLALLHVKTMSVWSQMPSAYQISVSQKMGGNWQIIMYHVTEANDLASK